MVLTDTVDRVVRPVRRHGLLGELDRPALVFAHLTPNWFATVMGTGIVAVAASSLPWQPPGLHVAAVLVWSAAAALLVALSAATAMHWLRHGATARGHVHDPVMGHFYGAVPMALLTVGAGTLLVGRDVVGPSAALGIDAVLWTVGTAGGVATIALCPFLHLGARGAGPGAFGGWLMPVVPPLVSASTGALLVPRLPAGAWRVTMLSGCFGLFAVSLAASLAIIPLILRRLRHQGVGTPRLVPTLWLVLGPLGQSVTAANLLGGAAAVVLPEPAASALAAFGVRFGIVVWIAAVLWIGVAATVTIRTAREHLPFSLTWWSFTFPVGTCVTGSSALALHTGAAVFRVAAVALYAGLVFAWLLVAVRTALGSLSGRLFLPPRG